jgi:hypothetical protein
VELDFGMSDGLIEVTMGVCMAYYFIFQLALDSASNDAEPESHELELVNRDEVEAAIKEAGRCYVDIRILRQRFCDQIAV